MREHIIARWCDQHAMDDPEAPPVAATFTAAVALDGEAPKRVDFCGPHWEQLVAPMVAVLREYGAAPDDPPAPAAPAKARRPTAAHRPPSQQPEPGTCPLCGLDFNWLSTHLTAKHGLRVAELVTPDDDGLFSCPACTEQFSTLRLLSIHTTGAHGRRLMPLYVEAQQRNAQQPGKAPKRSRAAAKAPAGG